MSRAILGVCTIELGMDGVYSLKEKRSIIQPLIRRLQSEFNASVAEIEDLDSWNSAVIAAAVVGNDSQYVNSVLSKIADWVETQGRDVEVLDHTIEIF
ncbi:MAG: hypothetical protein UZ15_CFX003003450 [Chloroflexi bacterium OLB15]|nr:MAG: hypothetical protein UZ15_CFX003003450 [Chloroflexi bacterium OLB15]